MQEAYYTEIPTPLLQAIIRTYRTIGPEALQADPELSRCWWAVQEWLETVEGIRPDDTDEYLWSLA